MSGNGAYDTRACHDAIKIKRAVALIPPRKGLPSRNGVIPEISQ
ncbi:hypothetical protein VCRA2123O443_80121 [Vibrio crassostreae]|nr:hypothetical protein VCRA2110O182_60121 [Vibrio crassostreae]CAK2356459.1 hypothetical protein VCRA2111O408_60076 [Vibrio crassostreae]CAK2371230.1 hypothetical protein VCRA211O406_60079 [Vibrio crassostreae]CAK3506925.1 hypothetical protein VCRA2123O443_80121 [Vibrio crassostreae]